LYINVYETENKQAKRIGNIGSNVIWFGEDGIKQGDRACYLIYPLCRKEAFEKKTHGNERVSHANDDGADLSWMEGEVKSNSKCCGSVPAVELVCPLWSGYKKGR
jgi:hypothetical protein